MRVHMAEKLKSQVKFVNDDENVEIDAESLNKNSRNKYECHWIGCGKQFKWLSGIKRHLGAHKKSIKCVWDGCDKTFAQNSNMRDHYLRIHCSHSNRDENTTHSNLNTNQNDNNSNDCNENEKTFEKTSQECEDRVTERNSDGVYVCEWSGCGLEFPYYSHLQRHINVHKGLKPLKCPECERTFGQKSNMRQHLLLVHKINFIIQNKRNSYKTARDQTSSNNSNSSNIVKSITRKYSIVKLKDKFDSFAIETYLAKKSYANFSHDGQFYVCKWPECQMKFLNYAAIRRHLISHCRVKPYKCPKHECDRTFSQKCNMISHFNTCHNTDQQVQSLTENDRSFVQEFEASNQVIEDIENELIEKNISDIQSLKSFWPKSKTCRNGNNENSRKNQRTTVLLNCPHSYCNQVFQSKQSLQIHVKSMHDMNNQFLCTYNGCEARFSTKQLYENHMKRHRIELRCHYEDCAYKTHLEFSYRYHISKHSGQQQFKCELCQQDFTFLDYLNTHMKKVHSIANPIQCEWPGCESSFGTVAGLRKHKSLHTGEKKYLCEWPLVERFFAFLAV